MIQILFTLFTAASANRLLLQNTPPFALQQPAPANPAPAVPQPLPAQNTPQQGLPQPLPAAPQQPATPQALPNQPAATQYVYPVQTQTPEPTTTHASGSNMDAKCDMAFVAGAAAQPAGSCAMKKMPIYPPMPNFKLNCGAYSSCAGSEFHIQPVYDLVTAGKSVYEIESLVFSKYFAGYYSRINFVNPAELTAGNANANANGFYAGHPMMEINRVECSETGSCQGLNIELDSRYTTIMQFDCENGCEECWVHDRAVEGAKCLCGSYPGWIYPNTLGNAVHV